MRCCTKCCHVWRCIQRRLIECYQRSPIVVLFMYLYHASWLWVFQWVIIQMLLWSLFRPLMNFGVSKWWRSCCSSYQCSYQCPNECANKWTNECTNQWANSNLPSTNGPTSINPSTTNSPTLAIPSTAPCPQRNMNLLVSVIFYASIISSNYRGR